MEAKDTVMSKEEADEAMGYKQTPLEWTDCRRKFAQAQAEISFKAGKEEEYKRWIKACRKANMLISEPEQLVSLYKAWREEEQKGGHNAISYLEGYQAKLKDRG